MYVDDIPDGSSDKASARELINQIYELLLKASMLPHKFSSNEKSILEDIPSNLHCPNTQIKVLGLQWDTETDKLLFNFVDKLEPALNATKRSILSESAKIFDPLGLIAPITMKAKLIFQRLWLQNQAWDDPIPNNINNEWQQWQADVEEIKNLSSNRYFFDKSKGNPIRCDLFAFGDASNNAYATAIYIKAHYLDNTSTSSLVLSKTRVAPLTVMKDGAKPETIVRLELLAALITARAVSYVQEALETKHVTTNIFCFTDSAINLHRIKNGPSRYKIWVGNRIQEILSLTTQEQWFHCPGTMNPADIPSRGSTATELANSELWWKGPTFIHQPLNTWPPQPAPKLSDDPEEKKQINLDLPQLFNIQMNDEFMKIFNRFSCWDKTVKLFSLILRFGSHNHKQFRNKKMTLDEKRNTEQFLWQMSQKNGFHKEYTSLQNNGKIEKNSKISQYNPIWNDSKKLIISNSRLVQSDLSEETKRPTILPKDCPIVMKFVLHTHMTLGHASTGYTLSVLRQRFRICNGRRQIQKILRSCTKKHCTKPLQLGQQMSPLPSLRTDDVGAFRNTSCDLFGPMYAKHICNFENCPHPKFKKVYGALFTCFHSRAIHLELINDQGTDGFLDAFRSFVGRRGTPNVMFSDNAKNFKCASKEIRLLYKSVNWAKVQAEGQKTNIEWIFNVEKAPWANRIAERMVRSVKTPLRIIIGNASLTFRQMSILLTEIEGMVNNRPLSTVTDEPDDLTPITPAELVIGRRMDPLPDPNIRKNHTNFPHLWRKRQEVLNSFWKRWRHDYLLSQDVRKKWRTPSHENLKYKIVLIRDDNLSRNEWKLGRIIETFPSKDGFIRSVLVKTPTSTLRRPIQRIALLESIF
jgi:hypothetical protein